LPQSPSEKFRFNDCLMHAKNKIVATKFILGLVRNRWQHVRATN
jgi:hypothetical protein